MLRTVTTRCELNKDDADALNHASGSIYTQVLVTHWRALRRSNHWISACAAEKLNDWHNRDAKRVLQAHSIDAAQQGFHKACKTAKTNKAQGNGKPRYPYKRKWYRTTVWKTSGIRQQESGLLLARARGLSPICVAFTTPGKVREVRLVFDLKQRQHFWHIVVDDGVAPVPVENGITAAIDLGEIHPVALTNGEEVCILSCRELRSIAQQTHKELEHLAKQLARCTKGSRRCRRLKSARRKMLARQKRRRRDLEHKVSRATVNWCKEHNVGTLAIGDVRDVADKTKIERRLNGVSRQKMSSWSHGTLRKYVGYKSTAEGIGVHDNVAEHYTSKTCPKCGKRNAVKGRNYVCTDGCCQFRFARDGVGAANILSRFVYGELARIVPSTVKYRRPFQRWKGLRSPADTRQVANAS